MNLRLRVRGVVEVVEGMRTVMISNGAGQEEKSTSRIERFSS